MVGHPNPQHKVEKPSRLFVNLRESKTFLLQMLGRMQFEQGRPDEFWGLKKKLLKSGSFLNLDIN